ncbi:hypothetical protein FRC10_011850 [Ceratobasidium sp. 414]|nr:hypothetical protein FRC10_011850 [Ceratobasidium sp. 414]
MPVAPVPDHFHPHAPRTGSPLARRVESPANRVQFADIVGERSRSPPVEMPSSGLSAAMAARAGSPAHAGTCVMYDVVLRAHFSQPRLPPSRACPRTAVCPPAAGRWPPLIHGENTMLRRVPRVHCHTPAPLTSAQDSVPRTSSSRLTIVRVPSAASALDTTEEHPNSSSPGPFGGSGSFRERSHTRRSSWGANSGTSSDGEGEPGAGGRKRSRMSFAFSSFTPISPSPIPARQGPPQRVVSPGTGPGFASTFGPAQTGRARTRSTGSASGGVDLSAHNPTQDRSGARAPQLSAQQLYDLAMASRDPAAPRATPPVPGVSASVEPAHFTALPEGEILPFLDRPKEVEALMTTPGTQSQKLFALLGALFPRRPSVSEGENTKDDGTTPTKEPQEPMWPPLPGEEKLSKGEQLALSPPTLPQPPSSKATPAEHPLGLPPNPTQWTYAQLVTHLTQTTREQLPDKEWVLFARACIRARSEALWERVKGCLGVPSDIYEDDETDEDEDEDGDEDDEVRRVGISELGEMSPVVGFGSLSRRDSLSRRGSLSRRDKEAGSGSERAGSDDDHEPEAWVEPVFPSTSAPGSTRGSVSNSPTHYFAGNGGVTGLGGGKGDSKSWAGSVSGRSDGGRMELIGEEEEEEEGEDGEGEGKEKGGKPAEPDSPMIGLRILTTPMSPTFHPATTAHSTGSPGFHVGGGTTPTGLGTSVPSSAVPNPSGSGTTSPVPPPSIDQCLAPPMPTREARAGAWVSPLSNTISTGGRGLSGMSRGGGWNSPLGGGGWNSPLSGPKDAWNPVTERGPGNPLFPSSFARLSLGPTLSANNPSLRSPPPAHPSMYPHLRYLRERYKWARPASENDFAITIASESSDAGGRF